MRHKILRLGESMRRLVILAGLVALLTARAVPGQGLTGALVGTVKDQQGRVIRGAEVRVTSRSLIGGPQLHLTDEQGRYRFTVLPPGAYVLEVRLDGFATRHVEDIAIGSGAIVDRAIVLAPAGIVESVVVDGGGSRIDPR